MQRRGIRGLVLGVGLSALLLAACGSSGGTAGTSTGNSSQKSGATSLGITAANGQIEVNLPFNADLFDVPNGTTFDGTSFDDGGNTLNATNIGKPGQISATIGGTSVSFNVPTMDNKHDSGVQMKIGDKAITVKVPKGTYKEMYLLEGAGNGPGNIDVTPLYSDGSSGKARTVQIDDWCALAVGDQPAAGAVQVLIAQSRLDSSGATATPAGCGMEGIGVQLNSSKTMTGFTLGNVQLAGKNTDSKDLRINIAGVTLQP